MPVNLVQPDDPYATSDNPLRRTPNALLLGANAPQLKNSLDPTLQGVAGLGARLWQWLQDQRAESVRQGLLDPQTGLPTQKGIVEESRTDRTGRPDGHHSAGCARADALDNPAFAQLVPASRRWWTKAVSLSWCNRWQRR